MKRLDEARQQELEPKRIDYAKEQLEKLGFKVKFQVETASISFEFKGSKIILYPYSGWHTGKTIKDGRGLENLLKQLRP